MNPPRDEHLAAAPDRASRIHDGTHQTRAQPRPGRRTGTAHTAVTHRPHAPRENA
ncbi:MULTISPECIES: hypothetical protein [Streptomyces]|uniref:Uncharacterized protein n=1 Tax=Streptomyces canarius TaxID=285453 RepID=A0ABQ3DH61_9ACTN|nr:hypothetical protein [Streptomyces canarius]GHA76627.1 hypothetical protein GCM10010345_93230 [Streptomyces canarius]